ncbi:hypothetical protein WDD9_005618 [Paenibacillus melissococcoides]|uniref:hypothetical protein n=1 Tax=Paenibacillus melissococcoides TaxID=2912268 RepID=UPI0021C4A4AF|nr:hypothetical protein [Paenibacillus melissococcoides]CAH8705385.1 hypothetical protein WDD9_000957 [Paenibacillus melissococcoides]CAH8719666.1 hypothetical protein WDD9_005618 [Paenibacillus melissococcoides]
MSKKQTTVEIQGVEYTFQHPGVRESSACGTDPKIEWATRRGKILSRIDDARHCAAKGEWDYFESTQMYLTM